MEQPKSIKQVAPELVALDAFSDVELTEEEIKLALLEARQKKYARQKNIDYVKKLREEPQYKKFKAEELEEQVKSIPGFVVDEFNGEIIWQLCLYFSGDQRCQLDRKKGLLLYGGVGCGKTTLMEFFRHNQTNSYAVVSVRDISYEYQKGGSDAITRFKTMLPSSDTRKTFGQEFIGACFDDLGTEVDKKHYGNESNVMAEILLNRYDKFRDNPGKTHITTNLNTTQLEERYGARVRSRLREMCNVIVFEETAPDRRK